MTTIKLCVVQQMMQFLVTFSGKEGHFSYFRFSYIACFGKCGTVTCLFNRYEIIMVTVITKAKNY